MWELPIYQLTMYFKGTISVDPSEITKIQKVKPQKAFKRMMYFLTSGKISDLEEQETFTAVSILQQLNSVFIHHKVTNLVRLSHDDIDFYFDKEGKEDDLKDALDNYQLEIDHSMSSHFQYLLMVLEHETTHIKYLIETRINRNHKVGQYPIDIKISGFLKEFKSTEEEEEANLKDRAKQVFESHAAYESFVRERKLEFEAFLNDLSASISKFIKIDDVKVDVKSRVLLPKTKVNKRRRYSAYTGRGGNLDMPYTYYGFGDFMFYTWVWSEMCHDHSLHIKETEIVSEEGEAITSIGDEAVDTSDAALFNDDLAYDTRVGAFDIGSENDYHNSMDSMDSSWFGGDFGGSDSGWFGSNCSSCSSCSSCGGCGGCGGCS